MTAGGDLPPEANRPSTRRSTTAAPRGGASSNAGPGGRYRVQGNQVFLTLSDGSTGVATVNMRQSDGSVSELMYEGTLYAKGLCE